MDKRCLLFVPAHEKFLNKIDTIEQCGIIIDLEDSIPENQKDFARDLLCDYLNNHESKDLFIRLNKEYLKEELILFNSYGVGFVIPKVEDASDILQYSSLIEGHEIIALIETPLGIVNLKHICSCDYVSIIAFGAEDYTSAIQMENKNDFLLYAKSNIVTYAKAYNKRVYDTPSFNVHDEDAFVEDVSYTIKLGFDGKLAIHPKHVSYINESFRAINEQYLRHIVELYEKSDRGVVVIDGKVYEAMHIDSIKKKLNI